MKVFGVILQVILTICMANCEEPHETYENQNQTQQNAITLEKEIITGIYFEDQSPILHYDTVATLVFQLPVPQWKRGDVVLTEYLGNCTNSTWTKGSSCPTTFHVPEVQNRFANYILNSQPLATTNFLNFNNNSNKNENSNDIRSPFECGVISKHFNHLEISPSSLEEYLIKLSECSPADLYLWKPITDPNDGKHIKEIYVEMAKGFRLEVWAQLPSDRIDAGLWSNAVKILNSLVFSNYFMEAQKWKMGLTDCKNGKIPSTLITPELLLENLQELSINLEKNGLKSVLSPEDISSYYQAEIADCAFTEEKLTIRILVPVSQSESYSLVRMKSAKFLDDDSNICEIHNSEENAYVLMDHLDKIAYDTDCRPNELCHVPSVKAQRINACASGFLNGSDYGQLVSHCQLSCKQISPFGHQRTWISQLNSEKFLIVGETHVNSTDPGSEVVIKCPEQPDAFFKPVRPGALEVTLPCKCQIFLDSVSYKARSPCDEEAAVSRVFHVIPLHWVSREKIQGKVFGEHLNFDETDLLHMKIRPEKISRAEEEGQITPHKSSTGSSEYLFYVPVIALVLTLIFNAFLAFKLREFSKRINSMEYSGGICHQIPMDDCKRDIEECEPLYEEPDQPRYLSAF